MGRISQPILLAPRGEFSAGALALKRRRKTLGRWGVFQLGFLRDIHWIASSPLEAQDIRVAVGASSILIAHESVRDEAAPIAWPSKEPGLLRLAFASRIDAKKNLQFLLEVLTQCQGRIHLDIIGPISSQSYWDSCQPAIDRMPPSVTVEYLGELPHAELRQRMQQYDAMALPTLGENFGHVVVEAWAAGCPVLVSDRTPWRNLAAQGGGWDLPLERQAWIDALERGVALTADEQRTLRRDALHRARRVSRDGIAGDEALRQLIVTVVQSEGAESPSRLAPEHLVSDSGQCK
jgi:glycosyltransferase involved in cell wall biosynthesis